MNSLKNALLLVSVAISLVGCASGPTFAEYSAKQRPVASGQGRVWFYRPSKIVGAAVQPSVLVNDVKVGKAQPGCFFFIDRDPGTYEAKCTTEWSHKAKINLLARDEKCRAPQGRHASMLRVRHGVLRYQAGDSGERCHVPK